VQRRGSKKELKSEKGTTERQMVIDIPWEREPKRGMGGKSSKNGGNKRCRQNDRLLQTRRDGKKKKNRKKRGCSGGEKKGLKITRPRKKVSEKKAFFGKEEISPKNWGEEGRAKFTTSEGLKKDPKEKRRGPCTIAQRRSWEKIEAKGGASYWERTWRKVDAQRRFEKRREADGGPKRDCLWKRGKGSVRRQTKPKRNMVGQKPGGRGVVDHWKRP